MAHSNIRLGSLVGYVCFLLAYFCPRAAQGSLKVVYAVNAGGRAHTDFNGIHYEADPLQNKVGTASDYGKHLLAIGRVMEGDDVLYRTERYHTATFGYDVPIDGDGNYALIMKFCEVYFDEPNMKVFDVVLNGQHTIVNELDIFHQVGRGTAHDEYAFFIVANGRLYYKDQQSVVRNNMVRLDFVKGVYDNPKINAFALLKGDVEHIPRLSLESGDTRPMDADMAVFRDRVSADSGGNGGGGGDGDGGDGGDESASPPVPANSDHVVGEDDIKPEPVQRVRKTSGPRHPNPYSMDDSSVMLPVFIAIGAFIPLLFCLCKL